MFELSNYKDVDDSVGELVNQYYALRDSGRYNEANALIESNSELLKPYFINADSFNKIELGISELMQEINSKQRLIISDTEPNNDFLLDGSEWLQPY